MHKTVSFLSQIGRHLIGGFRTRDAGFYGPRSRYRPHIGAKEAAKYARFPDGFMDAASRKREASVNV